MGAEGWKAELWRGARNVSSAHRAAWKLANGIGFRACDDMRPWSMDDRTLVLLTWTMERPVWLYDVEQARLRQAPVEGAFPHSAQWAPARDRLLLPFSNGASLLDATGNRHGGVAWNVMDDNLYTDWTRWGVFFVLARPASGSKTQLAFFEGGNGRLVEAIDLDPADLLPYDSGRFDRIPRSGFSLTVKTGIRAVGSLLDTWHAARFDPDTDTLRLATYRPVSPAQGHPPTCTVEARWVAVTLAA